MEVPVRILNTTTAHVALHLPVFLRHSLRTPSNRAKPSFLLPFSHPHGLTSRQPTALLPVSCFAAPRPASPGFLLSFAASEFSYPSTAPGHSDCALSKSGEGTFKPENLLGYENTGTQGFLGDEGPLLTTVLLGWLGAEKKHLRRYADLYTSIGIRTVPFVITVKELMGLDLGKRVERRIAKLAQELVAWLSQADKDGRERALLFHTFSNTGWLAYGALLDILQQKGDLMKKIIGCVVDSGGDPEINPQVWAAGFSAALLKKRSASVYSSAGSPVLNSPEDTDKSGSISDGDKPSVVKALLLSTLEMFFSHILRLPDINRRLSQIISVLSKNQPPCPQLYLYSTADKVIPVRSIELFIEHQKQSGREVRAYNFGSSPHVDHLRSFPVTYSTLVHTFLKQCSSLVDKTNR